SDLRAFSSEHSRTFQASAKDLTGNRVHHPGIKMPRKWCCLADRTEFVMTLGIVGPGRGYVYIEMTIKNAEQFKVYTALSAPAIAAAGGRYVVGGTRPEVLEGDFSADRVAIVEFDTAALARKFYHSVAYQAVREKRLSAASFKMFLLEGVS